MNSERKRVIESKTKRALRVRKRTRGTSEKPRLSVVKTNKHVYAQLIDDEKGVTLASTSTVSKDFQGTEFNRKNKISAKQIGVKIAELAKKHNVKEVVFDRGSHKYHGILAELADAAREQGLAF